jgi:hypothetical protein
MNVTPRRAVTLWRGGLRVQEALALGEPMTRIFAPSL